MRVTYIGPGRRVVRHVTLRRVKTRYDVLVLTCEGGTILSQDKNDRSAGGSDGGSQAETGHRQPDTVEAKTNSLLMKEFEEANNWARLVMQLYFAWFGLQFTINSIAIGWVAARTGPMPSKLIPLVLVGWNLMGTIGTVMVYKGLAAGDKRMKRVMEAMAKSDQIDYSRPTPQSPMPLNPISVVFGFCIGTMLISLLFWIVIFLFG